MAEINQSKLQEALELRKKIKDIQDIIDEEERIRKAHLDASKKKTQNIKNKKKKIKKLEDEEEIILKIAGYEKEEPDNVRGFCAKKGFFDMLNLLDQKEPKEEISFSQKYNSLQNTSLVAEVLFESTRYHNDTDTIVIDGKILREKIDRLINKRTSDIEAAKALLDEEWEKTAKTKSEETPSN